jgi:hypothetical protein
VGNNNPYIRHHSDDFPQDTQLYSGRLSYHSRDNGHYRCHIA